MKRADLEVLVATGVLTAKECEAMVMREKGMSFWQIGLALGVSRQTVHERVRRGHEKIRARKEAA